MGALKNIFILIAVSSCIVLWKDHQNEKNNRIRLEKNQINFISEIQEQKNIVLDYQFERKEFIKYFDKTDNQLKGLKNALEKNDIRLKRITQIVSTTVNTRDTIINKVELDSLVKYLSALKPFKIPFDDKTDCFYVKGEFEYDGEKYTININERQYNDTINHVSSWSRKKHRWLFGIKSGLFGKKISEVTLFNNCGYSDVIIINKK
jgi:hypothetical protein